MGWREGLHSCFQTLQLLLCSPSVSTWRQSSPERIFKEKAKIYCALDKLWWLRNCPAATLLSFSPLRSSSEATTSTEHRSDGCSPSHISFPPQASPHQSLRACPRSSQGEFSRPGSFAGPLASSSSEAKALEPGAPERDPSASTYQLSHLGQAAGPQSPRPGRGRVRIPAPEMS